MSDIPLKHVAKINAGQSPPSAEVSPLTSGRPFLQGNAEFQELHPAPRLECATSPKVAAPDDVLLSVRAPVGALNIADEPYGIGRGLCAITPTACEGRFLWWWLHSQRPQLDAVSTGTTYRAVTAEDIGALKFPERNFNEQIRIANFLDAETGRIDQLITLRKAHEQLVLERSESVISSLFSRREGQHNYRFRDLMRSNPCYGVLVPKFADTGVPLIRVSDLGKLDHDLGRLPKIEEDQAREYRRTRISPGDLLITVVGATIGRCDVAPEAADGYNVSRALARIQLLPGISPQMIASWVRGRDFRVQAELATSGAAAQPALNMSDITHFSIWLPKTDSGRHLLAISVNDHEHRVRSLLSALQRQLNLLAERRQALITAAVTGQFDVSTASGRNVTDGVTA